MQDEIVDYKVEINYFKTGAGDMDNVEICKESFAAIGESLSTCESEKEY